MELAQPYTYPPIIAAMQKMYRQSPIPYGILDASLYTVWHNEVMRRSCPALCQPRGLYQLTGDLALEDILDEIEATGSFQIPSNPDDVFTSRGLVIGAIPDTEYYFIQASMIENCGSGTHPTGLEKTLCDFEGPIRKNLSAILSASYETPEHTAIKKSVNGILRTLIPALDFARLTNGLYSYWKTRIELKQFLSELMNAVFNLGFDKNIDAYLPTKPVYTIMDTLLFTTIISTMLSKALLDVRCDNVRFQTRVLESEFQVVVIADNSEFSINRCVRTLPTESPNNTQMAVSVAAASFLGGSLERMAGSEKTVYRLTLPIQDDESLELRKENAGITFYPDMESYLEIVMGECLRSDLKKAEIAFSGSDTQNQDAVCFYGYTKAPLEPVKRAPLRTVLEKTIRSFASEEIRRFIITLEDEFQVIVGETLLALKKECGLDCIVMMPYRYGYFTGIAWSENLVNRALHIIQQADSVSYLTEKLRTPTKKPWTRSSLLQWFRLKHICPLCKQMVTFYKNSIDEVLLSVIGCINIYPECETVPIEKPNIPPHLQSSHRLFFKELGKRKTAGFLYSWNPRFHNVENELAAIQAVLKRQILKCIQEDGIEYFLVILENPFQIIAGEIVLSLQKEFPHIALFAVMTKNIGDFYLRKWGYAFAGRMTAILEAAQFRCWLLTKVCPSTDDSMDIRSMFVPYYHTLIHSTYTSRPVTEKYHAEYPNLKQVLLHEALEKYILEIEKRLRVNAILQYCAAVNIEIPASKKALLKMPYMDISHLLNHCFPVASGSTWLPETEEHRPSHRPRLRPEEQEGYEMLCKIYELLDKLNHQ